MTTSALRPRPRQWPASDPRVHRIEGPVTAGLLAGIEPVALARAGHDALALAEPVKLGADEEFDVRFIRLLREAISAVVRVDWSAESLGPLSAPLVCHLPPPRAGSALREENAAGWLARYQFGRCYYRIGPGFVLIKDARQGDGRGARYRLDEASTVAAFSALEQALYLPEATAESRELFGLLGEEGLTFGRGDWGTLLPFRMRRWPVPFSTV